MTRILLSGAALLLLTVSAAPAEVPPPPPNTTAVRVNGVLIPQERIQTELAAMGKARTITHSFASGAPRPADLGTVLDRLITRELLAQEARAQACVVSDADVEKAMGAERARWGSQERFEKSLEVRGISEAYLHERIAEDCVLKKLMADRIEPKLVIDEAAEREYYERNRSSFERNEPPPLHMIRLSAATHGGSYEAYAAMRKIVERSYKGEKFGDLAREVSEHPSASRGGFIGENPDPPVPFLDDGRRLRPRQFTDPLRGEDGAYLFWRAAERPMIPFEEARPKVRQALLDSLRTQRFRELLNELRAKARVEYLTAPQPARQP